MELAADHEPFHFRCVLPDGCGKGINPTINTPSFWCWAEQRVRMCDVEPGWSDCSQYLVGDFIRFESGTDYLGSPAYAAFHCQDQAGCRAHAPKAHNGDEHWRYFSPVPCP